MLAKWIDVPYSEVTFFCAGINHQSFFLEFWRDKEDLYPSIWKAIERPEIYGEGTGPDRSDETLRLFCHRVERSCERVCPLLPEERGDGERAARSEFHGQGK